MFKSSTKCLLFIKYLISKVVYYFTTHELNAFRYDSSEYLHIMLLNFTYLSKNKTKMYDKN